MIKRYIWAGGDSRILHLPDSLLSLKIRQVSICRRSGDVVRENELPPGTFTVCRNCQALSPD